MTYQTVARVPLNDRFRGRFIFDCIEDDPLLRIFRGQFHKRLAGYPGDHYGIVEVDGARIPGMIFRARRLVFEKTRSCDSTGIFSALTVRPGDTSVSDIERKPHVPGLILRAN